MKKIHKKDGCGIYFRTTTNDNEVTCKKCLRLINDEKAKKTYEVFFAGFDGSPDCKIIKAPTSSKAIYKCFKMFRFDAELIENIGIQFQWFRRCKPKAILVKDENIKPSLTYEEEQEQKKQEAIYVQDLELQNMRNEQ